MKYNMIVFMGGQGAGKGTFAHKMLEIHEYNYIETGAILRSLPENSPICKKITKGELVEDEDLFEIIANNIDNRDIILDGFPRTIGQAKWLVENYAKKFNIKIVYLNISEEKMKNHINKRLSEGGTRSDDKDLSAIQKRIECFKNITIPAINWLSKVNDVQFFDIALQSDDIE
ncbi:MAG: nucleoside monophosphate kinase, partial [Alphaproteobacteria bacterium]|nr:nucleoside monophosphate kinase [Alphaproteobacteria bacterium]